MRRATAGVAVVLVGGAAIGTLVLMTSAEDAVQIGREWVSSTSPGTRSEVDAADGRIGDQVVSAYDEDHPAIARMDPDLITALQDATRDARADGIRMRVNSGWRSRAYQAKLLEEAVDTYGSRAEARRWVMTPDQSAHVTGDAVDVAPTNAAYWLSQHGATYGLCQIFAHEIWHYELRVTPGGVCPQPQDPTTG